MKRFFTAVALCVCLLLIGLFAFMPSSQAQSSVLYNLLNLPAPPPPNPLFQSSQTVRDENFFDKKNPPNDNASLADLLDYWKYQNQFDPKYNYTVKPSEKSLGRIMDEIEKKPELLAEYLNVLRGSGEAADFVKKLYDREVTDRKFDKSWRDEVKRWLTYNSRYFSDELLQTARQAADTNEYVTNQDEVLALARVDWEKARPLLEKMLGNSSQPVSQTLARWAFYKHALAVNDFSDVDKYRKELQETVENTKLQPGNRDLAMDALVESGDFPGRDEWYLSLLSDETLYELRVNGQAYTGLTTIINLSPSDKYVEKMIELAAGNNPTIRNAVIKNLATLLDDVKTPEVARALVPLLENPNWAKDGYLVRARLIEALSKFTIPESVPGLILMLNEKEKREVSVSPNANTNIAVVTTTRANTANVTTSRVSETESYPFRSGAIQALEKQKDARAASALRQLLPQVEDWERPNLVRATLFSNGFTIAEQIEALEKIAQNIRQVEERSEISNSTNIQVLSNTAVIDGDSDDTETLIVSNVAVVNANPVAQIYNPSDTMMVLGNQLVNIEEPSNELVTALIDRINYLDAKNPQVALNLRRIIQNWKGAAINSLMLRDLKNGKADLDAVVKLLSIRKELREKQNGEIYDAVAGNSPMAVGIAACLLEDANAYNNILDGGGADAKIAMLGCARLIRAPLPIQKVAANLKDANKVLALAAERYLETEDSPEARQIVLSLYPNEAKILGAKSSFVPDNSPIVGSNYLRDLFISVDDSLQALPPYFFYAYMANNLGENERKLQKEVKGNQELLGIYSYDDNFIRIYKDKAVFSWEEDPARYQERALTDEEFENLKNYLVSQRVDELTPFLSNCEGCESKQLLMLGRAGGRRVFVRAEQMPPFFAELETIFAEMRKPPAKLRYQLEKNVAGLEILFADDNLQARSLWKDGEDFRVLIEDMPRRKQIEKEFEDKEENISEETEDMGETGDTEETTEVTDVPDVETRSENLLEQKKYDNFAWYRFDKDKLAEPTSQPASVEYIPSRDSFPVPPSRQLWKARAANVEIRASEEGLYKISRGQLVKIREGYYEQPLITPNGRWAIATKYVGEGENEEYGNSLVRVNLLTNKEFKIKLEKYPSKQAIAFLPALNKVLIFNGYYPNYESVGTVTGDLFLLDAETGLIQPFKGEVRPLVQQTFRRLQPVGANADEFWAAIPSRSKNETQVGVYNMKTLAFKAWLTIPQIIFDSMNMWVDEKENKVYFVYEGQLLALPLAKKTETQPLK